MTRQRTIIFLDEIHRFTKAQQDIFLPFVEKGTITLIGATTENPSFRINSALLSRCRVLTLEKLSLQDGMDRMIRRASRIKWRDVLDMAREHMTGPELTECSRTLALNDQSIDQWADGTLEEGAIKWLIDLSDGDGKAYILLTVDNLMLLQDRTSDKQSASPRIQADLHLIHWKLLSKVFPPSFCLQARIIKSSPKYRTDRIWVSFRNSVRLNSPQRLSGLHSKRHISNMIDRGTSTTI
jgi:hypothetical protein